MKVDRETIWHFTCQFCTSYWSIATMEHGWTPKKLYCPHCGKQQNAPEVNLIINTFETNG